MTEQTLALATIAIALLAVLQMLNSRSTARRRQRRQLLGLERLRALAQLLLHIQQHRGLSSGLLNGSSELEQQIEPLQRRVSRDISDLNSGDDWMERCERWQSVLDHWQRLANHFRDKKPEDNLREHNNLIQSILFVIDDMAQAHELQLLGQRQRPLQLLWRELLTTTEYIGQARAIGTGIAAVGHCDSVARIRLNYLSQKILAHTDTVWRDLALDRRQRQPVEVLVQSIHNDILRDRIAIKPLDFFDIASTAINGIHELYRSKLEQQQAALTGH